MWHAGYLGVVEDETRKPPPLMSMVRCMKAYETGIACKLSVSLIGINPQAHTAQMSANVASGELLIIEWLTLDYDYGTSDLNFHVLGGLLGAIAL